jgi:hypothetical protein
MMREIPRATIERDKEGVENVRYYGVAVTGLDRDGLLAALNQSIKQARLSFDNFKAYREFQTFLREVERGET